jgi:hypothetical protein
MDFFDKQKKTLQTTSAASFSLDFGRSGGAAVPLCNQ